MNLTIGTFLIAVPVALGFVAGHFAGWKGLVFLIVGILYGATLDVVDKGE